MAQKFLNGILSIGDVTVDSEHLILKGSSPEFYFHTTGNHVNWLIAAQESTNATLEFGAIAASTSLDTDASQYTPVLRLAQGGSATFAGNINTGGTELAFTVGDAAFITAKESLVLVIDSDNNQTSRVFQVKSNGNNGSVIFQVADDGDATFAGKVSLPGDLDFSNGTGKKMIIGSQRAYTMPAQNTKMRILTLANHTSCRVYIDSSENSYNQPIVLDIFYNSQSSQKPVIHRNNNYTWHTHSNDIRFTSDTSGHIYAEKVTYTTGRSVNIRKVEQFKGTVTLLDGSTTQTGGGANEVIEGAFGRLQTHGNIDVNSSGVIKMNGTEVISALRAINATTGTFSGNVKIQKNTPILELGTSNVTTGNSKITLFSKNNNVANAYSLQFNKDTGIDRLEFIDGSGNANIKFNNGGSASFAGTITSNVLTVGNSGTSRFTDTSAFPLQLNRGLAVDVHGTNGVVLGLGSYSTGTTYVDAARIAANLESATSGDLFFQVNNSGTYTNALTINNDTNATFAGDVILPATKALYLDGGGGTYIYESSDGVIDFYGDTVQLLTAKQNGTQSEVVVNEGSGDVDFRVEANNDTHAFFVEAEGSGKVGIGLSDPSSKLHIRTSTDHNFEVEETGGDLRLSALNDARDANVALEFAASSFEFLTGNATFAKRVVVQDNTSTPLSSLFPGTLVVQGSTSEDPIIAITDVNTANAAAGVFHQSSTSPGFPALVINAASNGSEQPLISARTNVNNTTGLGGVEVFAVDGDGDGVFAGKLGVGGKTPAYGLTLAQGTGVNNKIAWTDSTPNFRASMWSNSSDDKFKIATGNASSVETVALEIDTSQNVTFKGGVQVDGSLTGVGAFVPSGGGAFTGNVQVNAGGVYPLQTSSTQRYNIQIRNTGNSVNSGYGWWLATDTNFDFALHADGAADKLTLTRAGDLTIANDINASSIIASEAFRVGVADKWKIRGNSSNNNLAFEYAASETLADSNIKLELTSTTATFSGDVDVQRSSTGQILSRIWNSNTGGNGTAVMRIANSGGQANGARLEFSDQSFYNATVSVDRTNGMRFMVNNDSTNMADLLTNTALTLATNKNATFAGTLQVDGSNLGIGGAPANASHGTINTKLDIKGGADSIIILRGAAGGTGAGAYVASEYGLYSYDGEFSITRTNQSSWWTSPDFKLSGGNATFASRVKGLNFTSTENAAAGGFPASRDYLIAGTGDRGGGLVINDVSGARHALYAGGHDLTFAKETNNGSGTVSHDIWMRANATNAAGNVTSLEFFKDATFKGDVQIDGTLSGAGAFVPVGGGTFTGNVLLQGDSGNAQKFLAIYNEGTATHDDVVLGFKTHGSRQYSIGIDRSTANFTLSNLYASVSSGVLLSVDNSGNTTFAATITTAANQHAADAGGKDYSGSALNVDGGDISTGRVLWQGYQKGATDLCGINNETNRMVLYNYTDQRYLQRWDHDGNSTIPSGNLEVVGNLTAKVGNFRAPDATASIINQFACEDANNAATFRTTTTGKIFEIRSQNSGTLKFNSTSSHFTGNIQVDGNITGAGAFVPVGGGTFTGEISQVYDPGNAGAFQYMKNANSGANAYTSKKWQNDDAGFGEIWRNSSTRSATGQGALSFNMYNSADINFWAGAGHTLKLSGTTATFSGNAYLAAATNEGNLFFGTADANYKIFGGGTYGYMGYNTSGYHRFNVSGSEVLQITNSGNLQFKDNGLISSNTADGTDNAQLIICGGGSDGDTRGASVHLAGNENGNGGLLQLRAGDGSVGGIRLYEGGSERMRIFAGKVFMSNTGSTGTASALLHLKGTGDAIRVESTNTGAGGAQMDLLHFTTSPEDNDVHGVINFGGKYDNAGNAAYGSSIKSVWTDASAKHGQLEFFTRDDNDYSQRLKIDHDGKATFAGDVQIDGTLSGVGAFVPSGGGEFTGLVTYNTPSGGVAINIDAFTDNFGVIRFRTNGNASKWDVGMNSSNHFYIGNNGVNTALEIEEVSSHATFAGDVKTTGAAIGTTQADGDYLAKIYTLNADGFMSLYTGQATPLEKVRITSYGHNWINPANNGFLGIGTDTPLTKTHISHTTRVNDLYGLLLVENTSTGTGSEANSALNVKSKYGTSQFMQWEDNGLRIGSRVLDNSSAGNVYFTAGGDSVKMVMLAGGNIGINDNTPSQKLDVNGDVRIQDSRSLFLKRHGDDYAWRMRNESAADSSTYGFDGSNDLVFEVVSNSAADNTPAVASHSVYPSSANTLVLRETGRVGMGTATPGARLHVQKDIGGEEGVNFMNNHTGAGAAMRVEINVGAPAGDDPMLSFNVGNGGFDWTMGVDNSDGDKFKIAGGTDSHNQSLGSSTNRLTIDSGGNLTMSGDIVAFSDKKLKKNIKTLDGCKVYDMHGVSFDRIDTGESSSGVIAQEIQKVAPELVSESDGTLGVAYGNLTGYLIEAIKDLKAEIEELKSNKCNCNK